MRNKTVAIAGVTSGQYGAIWAQEDLRKVLGISGARVMAGDLPVSRGDQVFDESGRLADPFVAERLREHVAALALDAAPLAIAV